MIFEKSRFIGTCFIRLRLTIIPHYSYSKNTKIISYKCSCCIVWVSQVPTLVLNYILSCIKFVTFGSVPELVADGWLEREKAACIRNQITVASGTTYKKHLHKEPYGQQRLRSETTHNKHLHQELHTANTCIWKNWL